MSNKIEGIAVPILTPINEVEEINHEQLAALTDYVSEGGVNAIFVNGTTGEFARFSQKSRQELVSTVAKAAKGRVAVLAGVSECGTRLVIENIKRAEEAGADAIVTTMPYYFPTTSIREQIEFTEDVTASTKLPVLLYNIPPVTGYSLNEELLDHVCDIDNLYGIKDSSRKGREFSEAEGTLRREAEDLRGRRGIELFRPEKWRRRSGSVPGESISKGVGVGLEGVQGGRLGGLQEAL